MGHLWAQCQFHVQRTNTSVTFARPILLCDSLTFQNKRYTCKHFFCSASLFYCENFGLFLAQQPPAGRGLLIHEVSRLYTTTHHSRWDSSGRVISSSHRPLPNNTQQSQQTDIHVPGGIRTHNLSRRVAADIHLRPLGHWDRQPGGLSVQFLVKR